jgi:hypothetical protein
MNVPLGMWRSRTPVRRGHIDPPNYAPTSERRIGNGPSTVEGRISEAAGDIHYRDNNPQLQPGMLVILNRSPYRIVEIREKPDDLWPAKYEEAWDRAVDLRQRYGPDKEPMQRSTWRDRPVNVVVVPDGGGPEEHRVGPASYVWNVLPEHYAVCRSCGELPPCSEELMDKAVGQQMVKSELLMAIPAGNCMGCGEGISARQKTVAFPGPNLWRPDLPAGTARFHARGECSHWVGQYRAQWQEQSAPATDGQPALFGEDTAA